MTSEHVGLAALLLTLAGILWKGGTLSGRIDAGLSELRAIIVELKAGLLEQQKNTSRIVTLEKQYIQLRDEHTTQRQKLGVVYDKMFSLRERVAVIVDRGSHHDLDTDPPPKGPTSD